MKMEIIIGKQFARLKFARDYVVPIFWVMTAVSTTMTALNLDSNTYLPMITIGILSLFFGGYIIDTSGIRDADQQKTMEKNINGALKINEGVLPIIWKKHLLPIIKEELRTDETNNILKEILKELQEKTLKD